MCSIESFACVFLPCRFLLVLFRRDDTDCQYQKSDSKVRDNSGGMGLVGSAYTTQLTVVDDEVASLVVIRHVPKLCLES